MGKDKFCEEVKEVLEALRPNKHLIKKVLNQQDGVNQNNVWRYQYKKGEEEYEKILEFRKVKNLVEYLLDLNENNHEP